MGRYDKIKAYYNGNWYQPVNIKTYFGNWYDLGNNDSYVGSSLMPDNYHRRYNIYLPNNTRVTKYRHDYTEYGSRHSVGFFNILPDNGGLYVPSKSAGSNATLHYWGLKCMVYKTANVDQYIYRMETSGSGSGGSFLHVIWLADGRIKVEARRLGGTTYTGYSTNSYLADSGWVYLDMWANISTSGWAPLRFSWGSTQNTLTNIETYFVDGYTGYCLHGAGDTYVYLKDTFKLWAAYRDRKGNTLDDYISINLNTAQNGTDGSTYANLTTYQETYPRTEWL